MDWGNVVSIGIAAIAALSAWASSRASSRASVENTRASVENTQTSSRTDLEKEAYERARRFDTETIARQDAELDEIRGENARLHEEVRSVKVQNIELHEELQVVKKENVDLRSDVTRMKRQLARLEEISPALEALLRQRLEETSNDDQEQRPL